MEQLLTIASTLEVFILIVFLNIFFLKRRILKRKLVVKTIVLEKIKKQYDDNINSKKQMIIKLADELVGLKKELKIIDEEIQKLK